MEQKELTALLQDPASITAAQTAALKEVLERYPYFQAARAVRLKGLRNDNSLHYNKELKVTAAYTMDRAVLFDFITSEEFEQNLIANQIKKQEKFEKETPVQLKKAGEENNLALDQALKKKLREEETRKAKEQAFPEEAISSKERTTSESLPAEKLSSVEASSEKSISGKAPSGEKSDSGSEEILKLGKPLLFHKNESHSFSEWLKLTTAKPVEREPLAPEEKEKRSRKYELIDEFISKSPKINPSQPARKTNLAEERFTTPDALMTETLARVYLEQKNYKKAIQAYKILILKNPEKSGFFADQIRAIEKLKEQNSLE